MLTPTKNNYLLSSLFTPFSSCLHGFSTTSFGDMRDISHRNQFLRVFGYGEEDCVWPEQTHGTDIAVVTANDRGATIEHVDGLVYIQKKDDPPVCLTVHTADCTPILACDPHAKIIGTAHAGWKGTVGHIGRKLIEQMVQLGGTISDIRVIIGPRIGSCCYDIDEERAVVFRNECGEESVECRDGKFYGNIGKATMTDLLKFGLSNDHVEYDETWCTSCRNNCLFSFRKNGKMMTGEIMGVIGWKSI